MNSSEVNKNNLVYWNDWYSNHSSTREDLERNIEKDDWMWIFKNTIEDAKGPVIDLGCGDGTDTLYMLHKGKRVVPCDGSMKAILDIRKNFPEVDESICFDLLTVFPFANSSTDLIVADLSLHYFTREDTIKILKEARRVLKNSGHMLARVNSINDVNHGAGEGVEVEPHLYMTDDGRYKRFFSSSDVYDFFNMFDIKHIHEEPMKRYKLEKKTYVVDVKNIK